MAAGLLVLLRCTYHSFKDYLFKIRLKFQLHEHFDMTKDFFNDFTYF